MSPRFKVSVVLTSNRSTLNILTALDNLVDKSRDDFEYLINLDNVEPSIKQLLESRGYNNLRIFEERLSLSDSLNFLVSAADGQYIARADDDDQYLPRRLALQSQYLDSRDDVDVVGAGMYLRREGEILGVKLYPASHHEIVAACLTDNHAFAHPVVMGRRSFFQEIEYKNIQAEDYDLWVRGIVNGKIFGNLELPLLIYSLPEYSHKKLELIRESLVNSVRTLIRDFFVFADTEDELLLRFFRSGHEPSQPLNSDMSNVIQRFLRKVDQQGFGSKTLIRTLLRYSPRHGRVLDALSRGNPPLG